MVGWWRGREGGEIMHDLFSTQETIHDYLLTHGWRHEPSEPFPWVRDDGARLSEDEATLVAAR